MTSRRGWVRVRRDRLCPICERPDWCLISEDRGAAICARVESSKKCGDAGWLHRLHDDGRRFSPCLVRRFVRPICTDSVPSLDFAALAEQYRSLVDPIALDHLARELGLSVASLRAFGVGWNGWAWSFPMTNVAGNVLGIRLRRPDGSKLSVKGGKEGLFLAANACSGSLLLICEGPTDAAALLDLGFGNVAGRPSCTGGVRQLVDLVRSRRHDDIVIVADGDLPGQRGADNLASVLVAYGPTVRVIQPPSGIKDARAWLRAGGTHQDVQAAIDAAPVRRLLLRASRG